MALAKFANNSDAKARATVKIDDQILEFIAI
jgi:hypothetical protein